jgi:plasmid stabilization system protein ParE
LEEEATLPFELESEAQQQIEIADEWWQVNRPAAPNAILEDFQSMTRVLARNPGIGRRSTNSKTPNVRQVFLRRVGYVIYYRIIGSPARLQILAFWHAGRGTGPPI